jgi:outer membrane receptor protein involved in Fe transport
VDHRSVRLRVWLTLGLLLTAAPAVQAQDDPDFTSLNLEKLMTVEIDTVHGPSRYLQKISDAPASISIVTADEIRAFGLKTFSDVLNTVRGIYVSDDRNYSYFGTRGLAVPGDYNSRMLVLVDGHRINDNIYDSVLAGTEFPLDIDLIDRVEVIRGPGSAMYGANAVSAVINVITRRGERVDGVEAELTGGTLGTGQARVTFGKRYANGVETLLSTSGYTSDGDRRIYFPAFDDPATNDGVVENADRDRSRSFLGVVSFGDVVLRGLYGGRRKQVPTASFGARFNDPREQTFDSRGYVEVQYAREVGLFTDVLSRGYYDYYHYDGDYPLDVDGGTVLEHDNSDGRAVGAEVTVSRRIGNRNRLMVGSEYRFNFRQDVATYELGEAMLDARHQSGLASLSVQDEVRVRKGVLASAALRYDKQSDFGGRLTPRASLVLSPSPRTHIKLMAAQAFRAPSIDERFYELPLSVQANPDLHPETIRTYEVAVEQTLTNALSLNASLFDTDLVGVIVTEPFDTGVTHLTNTTASGKGVELMATVKGTAGASVTASYSYLFPEDKASEAILHDSPRHLAKLRAMTPLGTSRIRGAFQLLYNGTITAHTGEWLASSLIANASVTTWSLWPNIDLGASVYNLFNASAAYPVSDEHVQGSVPQYGRRFLTRVTVSF